MPRLVFAPFFAGCSAICSCLSSAPFHLGHVLLISYLDVSSISQMRGKEKRVKCRLSNRLPVPVIPVQATAGQLKQAVSTLRRQNPKGRDSQIWLPVAYWTKKNESYSSHSEPNGLNRNKTVFSVTFQNIKNPKKPYKISIFDAKPQKHKQFVPSSIIGSQIPNLRRWRDVGGM